MATSGGLSITRCPVNSDSAAPVRAKAMLMSSERASLCRSVSFTGSSFRKSSLHDRKHLFGNKWLINETQSTGFINHLARRTLDVGACDHHQRLWVHLTQLHEYIDPVHALHHQIQQYETRFFQEVDLQRRHSVFRFHHRVISGFEDPPQRAARKR